MAITMNTYSGGSITHKLDGSLRAAEHPSGILSGCGITVQSSKIKVSAGRLLVHGRLITIDSETEVSMPVNQAYAVAKLKINENTGAVTLYGVASQTATPSLTQDEINDAGSTYEVALAVISVSSGALSRVVEYLGNAVPNGIVYGTAANPPSKNYPEGTLYIQYV